MYTMMSGCRPQIWESTGPQKNNMVFNVLCFIIPKKRNVKGSQPVTVQITSVKPRTSASGADLCTQLCSQQDRNSGKSGCLIQTNQNQPKLTPTHFWWLRREEGSLTMWKICVSHCWSLNPNSILTSYVILDKSDLYFCKRECHRDL